MTGRVGEDVSDRRASSGTTRGTTPHTLLVEQCSRGTHVDGRGGSVGGRVMHDDDLQAVVQRDGAVCPLVVR